MRRAHHGHVAGVIGDAILLLVGAVVLLIDDDEAELRKGQEQRRARADNDLRLARSDGAPDARARLRALTPECHSTGGAPKRAAKRATKGAVSAISGISTRVWRPASSAAAMASKIDLGLAGAGHAFQQRHGEGARRDAFTQRGGGLGLARRELRRVEPRIVAARDGLRRKRRDFERAIVDQTVDDARGAAGGLGERRLADGPAPSAAARTFARAGVMRAGAVPTSRTPVRAASGAP